MFSALNYFQMYLKRKHLVSFEARMSMGAKMQKYLGLNFFDSDVFKISLLL